VQGRLAYRKDKWEEALENFVKAIEIKPDAAAAYPVVGDLYFYFGDIAQFKKAYQQYFQLNTQDHHMRIWYAGKFMEIGQFVDAAKELKKLPAEQKKEAQVANLLGVCLLKTDQPKEALQALGAVALKSKGTGEQELTTRYFLAKAYLQTGDKGKAQQILRKLQDDQPGFEDVEELLKNI
jgi:predicted Zn-dependent protease